MYVHRFVATEDRLDRRETLCFIIILFFNKNVKLKTEIYIYIYNVCKLFLPSFYDIRNPHTHSSLCNLSYTFSHIQFLILTKKRPFV